MTEEPIKNLSHRPRYVKRLQKPCPQCGSYEAVVDNEAGEVVCKKCGLVLNEDADTLG
jgi:transcription elongation factor Elf1